MQRFVIYRRVSTSKQERSGLGLESQDRMIQDYVASVSGSIVAGFQETESGKRKDRPELKKALAACRKHKAILLTAKLDRLARNVAFVSQLLETPGVEFRAADCPGASRMMIQMLSVFAEYERQCISDRTKAALAARKARGLSLGTPENLRAGNDIAPALNRAKARASAERMRPIIESIRAAGIVTIKGIAAELNARGYLTESGNAFHPTQVVRVLGRLNLAA